MRILFILLLSITSFGQNNLRQYANNVAPKTPLLSEPRVEVWDKTGNPTIEYGAYVYFPEGYDTYPNKKWPALVFEHGTGGRGTGDLPDLNLLITDATPTLPSEIGYNGAGYKNAGRPKGGSAWNVGGSNPYRDMLVFLPQTSGTMDRGNMGRYLQDIIATYRVDQDRIFLTGFSLGFIGIARYLVHLELDYNRTGPGGDRPPIAGAFMIAGQDWQTAYATLTVDRGITVNSWVGENDPSGAGNYRVNSELVVTDINAVRASYATFTLVPGEAHTSAVWGPVWQNYSSTSIYAKILDHPLRIVPSKSTGGTWPVTGFTSAVTLPGGVDLLADDIKVMLVTGNHTPAGDDFINDVTGNELIAPGYTVGGVSLTGKTLSVNDFDANDVTWTNSEFSNVRYIYLYKNTGVSSTSPIIGFINLNYSRSTSGNDFVIQWYSTGILTKT